MGTRAQLTEAKNGKNDRFYTRLVDIENEMKHYKKHFKDKVIYCNCDDPTVSNFFHYFAYNFHHLGLKKLITTCYKNGDENEKAYYYEYTGELIDDRMPDIDNVNKSELKDDGDFRSEECVELLKQADIIVTNPPFSLFREYIAQLIKYDKSFIIVGNQNAIGYKETFKLIKESKLWLGFGFKSPPYFINNFYENYSKSKHIDNMIAVNGVTWFTNLHIKKRDEELILHKNYNDDNYPMYENYDAINVDKTKDIPIDYDGLMGVPISFMHKYNPKQFEIIALGVVGSIEFKNNRRMEILKNGEPTGKFTYNGKGTLYRKHRPLKDKLPVFKDVETGELYQSIYSRIIIRRR